MEKLLSRKEAANLLGLAPMTLANWHSQGSRQLPAVKVGRLVRYRLADLERWVADRTSTGGADRHQN